MKKGTILTLSEKDLIDVIVDSCPEIEQDKSIIIDSIIPNTEIERDEFNMDFSSKSLSITFHVA